MEPGLALDAVRDVEFAPEELFLERGIFLDVRGPAGVEVLGDVAFGAGDLDLVHDAGHGRLSLKGG